jgi:hypothetical protein
MRLIGSLLLVLIFTGCNKEKLKSPEAFFIKTGAVGVNTITAHGSASHKITDLWLYVDGNFKGTYPVGSTLPITSSSGHARINIYGGIKNNGISFTRLPYDFYENLQIDTTVTPGTTVNRNLNFTYKSASKFLFMETFEGGTQGINMVASIDSDLNSFFLENSSASFEGACMKFTIDDVNKFARFQSTSLFALPLYGVPAYLEINYKCDQPFEVGVYTSSGDFKPAANVNTSSEWNKIYILLSTASGSSPVSLNQGIYVKAIKDQGNGAPASATIYIDNIKVISL